MKKALSLFLAIVLVFSLAACGSDSGSASSSGSASGSSGSSGSAGSSGSSGAYEYPEMTIMYATASGAETDQTACMNYFADIVNERSGGKITVNIYDSASLGSQQELTEACDQDTVNMVWGTAGQDVQHAVCFHERGNCSDVPERKRRYRLRQRKGPRRLKHPNHVSP